MVTSPDYDGHPLWYSVLTKSEIDRFEGVFGKPSAMNALLKFEYGIANFFLLKDCVILSGTKFVDDGSADTYRKIQDFCFEYGAFCPMISHNLRFDPDYSYLPAPKTVDLTPSSIIDGKVIAYREKIDGAMTWRTTVTKKSDVRRSISCYVGGISIPLIPHVNTFEYKNMRAYSISPVNVTGSVNFPFGAMSFVTRNFVNVPDYRRWSDGAIAYLFCDGQLVERRVKKDMSSELEKKGDYCLFGDKKFLLIDEHRSAPDGIYECTYYGGKMELIAYRPFKTPDPKFFHRMNLPILSNVVSTPFKLTEMIGDAPSLYRDVFFFPPPVDIGDIPMFCAFVNLEFELLTTLPINARKLQTNDVRVEYNSEHGGSPSTAVGLVGSNVSCYRDYPLTVGGIEQLCHDTMGKVELTVEVLPGRKKMRYRFFPFYAFHAVKYEFKEISRVEVRAELRDGTARHLIIKGAHKRKVQDHLLVAGELPKLEIQADDPLFDLIRKFLECGNARVEHMASHLGRSKDEISAIVSKCHYLKNGICYLRKPPQDAEFVCPLVPFKEDRPPVVSSTLPSSRPKKKFKFGHDFHVYRSSEDSKLNHKGKKEWRPTRPVDAMVVDSKEEVAKKN